MDWNKNGMNGAVSSQDNNQQYLQQSTSCAVPTMQNQMTYVSQNACGQSGQRNTLLKQMLDVNAPKDVFVNVQKAALGPYKRIAQLPAANQLLAGQYNAYNHRPEIVPTSSTQSGLNIQNPVTTTYRMVTYTNTAPHTAQQPVPVLQQYAPTGQQPMPNTQASVGYVYPHQNVAQQVLNGYSSQSLPGQKQNSRQSSKTNSPANYTVPNGNSGQCLVPNAETTVAVSSQDYRNNPNYQAQAATNYAKLQTLPYGNRTTAQQWNANYVQAPQKQLMGNFPNPAATNPLLQVTTGNGTSMPSPPPYTQTAINKQNEQVNQQHANQSQHYAAQNVPQPHHSATGLQAQASTVPATLPQASVSSEERKRRQERLILLHLYRKCYYLEQVLKQSQGINNLQGDGNASAGSAALVPAGLANNVVAGQQSMTQNVPVLNPSQIQTAQGQNVYYNAVTIPAQNNLPAGQAFHGNVSIPNQVPTSNRNVLEQNNYSVFDGGQMCTGSVAASAAQGPNETLRDNCQNVPAGPPTVQASNQGVSSRPHYRRRSQNGAHVNSLQSLDQPNPGTSETFKTAVQGKVGSDGSSLYADMFNANNPFPSSSREAIEAALPLWKPVPQNSSLNTDGPTANAPSQLLPVDAVKILEEMTLPSTNEASPVVTALKPDMSAPNASKSVEPQIAIVSPLVQSKEMAQTQDLLSKGQDVEGYRSMNLKDNECFNKILQSLLSLSVPVKEEPDMAPSAPLPSDTEASSEKPVDPNSAGDENDLQISGICTLVEGNTLYNSSIAMMFEDSANVKTECDAASDVGNAQTIQHSEQETVTWTSEEAIGTSPKADMVALDEQPAGSEEAEISRSEEILNDTSVQGFEIEKDPGASPSGDFCDLEASSVSDQLSELLTVFPYGIKNYMSENKPEKRESPEKLSEKPVIHSEPASLGDPQSAFNIDQQDQDVALTSPEKLTDIKTECSLETSALDPPPAAERAPTPTENVEGPSKQFLEDGFEVVCDSPEFNIEITLIPQDEIPKIFPDDPLLVPKCEPTETETWPEATSTDHSEDSDVNVELNPLKKDNEGNEAIGFPDKDLFCCLFSWLNHTNRNAPKCSCKVAEVPNTEQGPMTSPSDNFTNKPPSPEYLSDTPSSSLCESVDCEPKEPEALPFKDPLFDPVECSSESRKHLQNYNYSQQEETKRTTAFSAEQVLKVDLEVTKGFDDNVKASRESKSQTKEPSPNKTKLNPSPKCEKLIIKTDFLKGKHLHKGKKKDKERKRHHQEMQGVSDSRGDIQRFFNKSPGRKALKAPNDQKTIVPNIKHSYTSKPMDRRMSMPNLSPNLQKTTPTIAKTRPYERKNKAESHFEKTRKSPSIQEYLKRKRELCNRSFEEKFKQRDDTEVRPTYDERSTLPQREYNPLSNHKRQLSPVKINVASKTRHSEPEIKGVSQTSKDPPSTRPYHKQSRNLDNVHGKEPKKAKESKYQSSKDKIYLSPCVGSSGPPNEGLNITKLQIRCSPVKRKYQRRKSLDSSLHSVPSKSDSKKMTSPKMLEFKLCPEFVLPNQVAQEKSGEPKATKEKNAVEGIKSKKEAWCNNMPLKKRKLDRFEQHGSSSPSTSKSPTPTFRPPEKSAKKSVQDSQATFNAYKQKYQEQRSKSLDASFASV